MRGTPQLSGLGRSADCLGALYRSSRRLTLSADPLSRRPTRY